MGTRNPRLVGVIFDGFAMSENRPLIHWTADV